MPAALKMSCLDCAFFPFWNICVLSSNHPDCKTDKSSWPLNPKFARSLCLFQHAAADLAGSAGNRAGGKMDELEHQAQLLINCWVTKKQDTASGARIQLLKRNISNSFGIFIAILDLFFFICSWAVLKYHLGSFIFDQIWTFHGHFNQPVSMRDIQHPSSHNPWTGSALGGEVV